MLLLVVLAVLGLGALLGAAGMRRLGQVAKRVTGPWRPGVGVVAVILAFAGLAAVVRGAWIVGLPVMLVGGGLALTARARPKPKKTAAPASSQPSMSEGEARAMLGVGAEAGRDEIQAAYLRLMQRVHPDQGGAVGLASQLNAARKRLLG